MGFIKPVLFTEIVQISAGIGSNHNDPDFRNSQPKRRDGMHEHRFSRKKEKLLGNLSAHAVPILRDNNT